MIQPARLDEAAALATFLREQVEAVRTAAFGLTEEEARTTPGPQRPQHRRHPQAPRQRLADLAAPRGVRPRRARAGS